MSGVISGLACFALLVGLAPEVPARESEYPNKDITWIVTYPPGGGYDAYARAIARILPRYLPRKVRIVVKNATGAGGRRGAGLLYRSTPDGYTIGILNSIGLLASDLVKKSTQFDLARFTYLATCGRNVQGIFIPGQSKYRTLEDLQKADRVRFATGGRGSQTWLWGVLLREELNIPLHFVSGYLGTGEYLLALIRNDVDVTTLSLSSSTLDYAQTGTIRPLLVFSLEPWDLWPGVPTLKGTPYEDFADLASDRLIAGPPGLPDDITAILRTALLKALHDPDLQAWAKETQNPLYIRDAEQAFSSIRESMRLIKKYEKHLK